MPLYDGISEIQLLAELAGLPIAKGAEYIQDDHSYALTSAA